jgi:hypothetical protein
MNGWKRSVNFHRFSLGDAGGLIDSRVSDLCNHVGFTDVAAPRGCWQLLEQKKLLDSRLTPTLSQIYFSFICTWFRVNRTTNKHAMNKNMKSFG